MNKDLIGRMNSLWLQGGASQRGEIERIWPELAEVIDMIMISSHLRTPLPDIDLKAGLLKILDKAGVERPQFGTKLHAQIESMNRTEEALRKRPMRKPGEPECKTSHGISVWPYAARCVLVLDHQFVYDHIDRFGNQWRNEPCDACRAIARMEDNLTPGDEAAYYDFKRAANHHRKECPNR